MPTETQGIIKFWPEFVEPILKGDKTQSRRRGERSYKIGQKLHVINTETEEHFANLLITNVFTQNYIEMSDEEGIKDGFKNKEEFWETFSKIYNGIAKNEKFTVI